MVAIEYFKYLEASFDAREAERLLDLSGLLYAVLAGPLCMAFGALLDCSGPPTSLLLSDGLALAFAATLVQSDAAAQVVSQVLFTGLVNLYYVLVPGLAQRYSPAELFGTVLGAIFGLMGMGQVILFPLSNWLAAALEHHGDTRVRFIGRLMVWTVLVIVAGAANFAAWRRRPPPPVGSVTMSVIRRHQKPDQ